MNHLHSQKRLELKLQFKFTKYNIYNFKLTKFVL